MLSVHNFLFLLFSFFSPCLFAQLRFFSRFGDLLIIVQSGWLGTVFLRASGGGEQEWRVHGMSSMTESAKQSDSLWSRDYWKHLINSHSLNYALCHISLLLCCCLMDWWPFQLSLLEVLLPSGSAMLWQPEISFTRLSCSKINFGSDWHKANFHLSSKYNSCQSIQQRCSWTIKYNQKHLSLSIFAFVCLIHYQPV